MLRLMLSLRSTRRNILSRLMSLARKYIGAYAAAMGGVDAIVFTAGVGENQTDLRENSCKGLEFLGIKINKEVNDTIHGKEAIISTDDSKVKVVVVPTDEEIVIARDTMELVK